MFFNFCGPPLLLSRFILQLVRGEEHIVCIDKSRYSFCGHLSPTRSASSSVLQVSPRGENLLNQMHDTQTGPGGWFGMIKIHKLNPTKWNSANERRWTDESEIILEHTNEWQKKKQTIPAKKRPLLHSDDSHPNALFGVLASIGAEWWDWNSISGDMHTHTPTDTHTHIDRYGDQSWAWQPNGRPGLFPVANRPRSSWGRVCFALGSSAPVQGTTTPSPCLTRQDEAGTMLAKLSALPRQSDPQTKGVTVHRDESARPHRWRCEFPAVTDRFLEVRIHHGREENEKTESKSCFLSPFRSKACWQLFLLPACVLPSCSSVRQFRPASY